MNSERQQAYLNLINQLLTCPTGEEAEVLKAHPDLLDDGLVAAMLEEAENLREQGKLNNAVWLKNFAGLLGKVDGDLLAGLALKAEADRLCEQGNEQYKISQFREALQSYEQALTIYREIGNPVGEAASLNNLGNAYDSLGDFNRAIDFYQKSLAIQRKIGYPAGEAASLCGLGNAYYSLGDFNRAIDFYEQSLVIQRKIGNPVREANSLGNLGNAYYSLGDFNRAIDFYEQSLVIERKIGDRQGEGGSLCNLGKVYQSLEQYHNAIELYQQSLQILRKIGHSLWESNSLGNLGNAYYSLGDFNRAIDFYEQSLAIKRHIGDRAGEAGFLSDLGKTLFTINQFPEAEEKLRASIKIYETLRSKLVNNHHKASIFETQISAYRLLQQVLVAQTKYDEALEISEMGRTRAFAELLHKSLLTTDLTAKDVTNKLSIARIKQIAQQKNSTIVEYSIITKNSIYIWVIQPNGNITHRAANLQPLNQQNQSLEQIILKTRVSIGVDEIDDEDKKIHGELKYQPDMKDGYPLLKILYQILIEPIADLLPTDPNTPIIFIPHYELFLVPFTALQSANNRYLIEDHTILTAPSIQVLEQTSEHQERVRGLRQAALVVGDPTIHPKFQKKYEIRQLPWAEEAAEEIAMILGTTAIVGEKATKVAILERMLNTRIIHLSAHGLLDDIQGSGIPGTIILAPSGDTDDGALNAAEILQLKLDSELVVLSACSTGGGKITGDGVNGLSRCFILAGVPSIIVSLWNMGADSAKLVMIEFYQNLQLGDNRDAALRHAMLSAKDEFSSPSDWASFTLIGETETLLF